MQANPGFLRRLYAESAMLLEQEAQIEHWRVVVLCPHRGLNFGRPAAVAEFLHERVQWIELEPAAADPGAPPLLRALALLVQPEEQIAATLISRFNGRSIAQLSAMAGITVDEFTQSVAYREIFGQGRQEGELELTLRQLSRRCGPLSAEQETRIRALPLERLEALAEALLDFRGAGDLVAWLEVN